VLQVLHWTLSNGRLLSSDQMLSILNCLSSVLCNGQLVTVLSERESASFVCSATAAVHALVCSCESVSSLDSVLCRLTLMSMGESVFIQGSHALWKVLDFFLNSRI